MTELILTDLADSVLTITLNRPDARNQWTAELETQYFDALDTAGADASVRAVVVTGAGRTFCPGLDPAALAGAASGKPYLVDRRPQTFTTTVGKPVIAAINGSCGGIGLLQALYCDRRIAAPGVRMATAFGRRGLPAEDGAAWILGRLAGPSRAFDLMVGTEVFTSEQALGFGVVDAIADDPVAAAREYAIALAASVSPVAAAMIKHQVWHDLGSSLEEARLRSRHLLAVAKLQPDVAEGAAALQERRAPIWPPFTGLHL